MRKDAKMSPATLISEAQLTANRQNAQLSTGPNTDDGKSRVRLNSLRHGLTGNTILMPYEDATQYQSFIAAIAGNLQPEGPAEQSLARSIADGHWRLNRARAIEENIFALGAVSSSVAPDPDPDLNAALNQAQTFLHNAHQIQLLTLYAGRIDRLTRKNAADLKELQAARLAAQQKALAEATLLTQLAESKGAAYDPSADGFGFSKLFLDRHIDRQTRLTEARRLFRKAA